VEAQQKSTLSDWFATPRGEYVLRWEQAQFDSAVEDVFGFNAVQVGLSRFDLLRQNRIPLRTRVGLDPASDLVADSGALPLATGSVDLVVLPHVLEFSAHPHRILREAARVLMPDGQIVISGFNPLSLWGLKRALVPSRNEYPWCGRFIGLLRLKDWLQLLSFELNGGRFGCYAPPFSQSQLLGRSAFMEKAGERWWPIAGGVYVVRAVKRTIGMRLVMPSWRSQAASAKALSPVTQRNHHRTGTED
jgi:SAM-dependent methyltransferase